MTNEELNKIRENASIKFSDDAFDRGHVIDEDVWFSVYEVENGYIAGFDKGVEVMRDEVKKYYDGFQAALRATELNAEKADYMEADRNRWKAEVKEIISYLPKVPTEPYEKQMAKEILELRGEVDEWKAKYIEARKSGYAEGLEEQKESRDAWKQMAEKLAELLKECSRPWLPVGIRAMKREALTHYEEMKERE